MTRPNRIHGSPVPADVPRHMADAVLYLSQVAEDAGMIEISKDLRTIRLQLLAEATRPAGPRNPCS